MLTGRRAFFGERNVEVAYGLASLALIQRDLKDTGGAEAGRVQHADQLGLDRAGLVERR